MFIDRVREGEADVFAEAVLRAAERPGCVEPAFQPIVDLRRGMVSGYEMLARFSGPPQAPPDIWFAQAEQLGVAGKLEARMIRAGLEARHALPANCFLTINVGPERLRLPDVQAALAEHTRLHGVVIELTEHAHCDDELIGACLPPLRRRGAMIALDDVGSGYSGLRRIGAVRPEFVKIDRALVTGLHADPTKREMVESLGAVANRVDAWVIAEGVEERAELEDLIAMRVPLGQGYALARPGRTMAGPRVDLTDWICDENADREETGYAGRLWYDVAPIRCGAPVSEVRARFAAVTEPSHLPAVDERGRPTGLIARHRYLAGDREASRALLTLVGDDPVNLARRAMARPPETRFDPLVCCDEVGRYVGLIGIERLVEALAR